MFWKNWFTSQPKVVEKVVYKVIEIRAPRIAQKWSKETKDTVSTLASHPGFVALMDRVALHRQMLEHKCSHEFHKDLRESDYLQAGVFWLGYLDRLIAESTKAPRAVAVDAYDEELEAFKELDARIERIGMESSQETQ